MKNTIIIGGLAAILLSALTLAPASADPPRHSHSGRYDRSYNDRYQGDRYRNGRYYDRGYGREYGSRGYSDRYDGDFYRHNNHAAERKKFTHSGRHVVDRKHGHHR